MMYCQEMKMFLTIIDRLYSFTILNRVICQGVIGWLLMLRTKSSITLIAFGLPPFQEMVNHARKKNLTLLHQNNQIQNLLTTTCGYFCLYFLNEMNKGKSYFDLLEVFDIYDTTKNERFLERYFKNM